MTARCIRCGGDPIIGNLFCERCWGIVAMEAIERVPAKAVDGSPITSPWVRDAVAKRLPAKSYI
jgi:hypothetical protein